MNLPANNEESLDAQYNSGNSLWCMWRTFAAATKCSANWS